MTLSLDTRRFRLWIRFMRAMAPFIGDELAYRWACKYGVPLLRIKLDNGKWERPWRWDDVG